MRLSLPHLLIGSLLVLSVGGVPALAKKVTITWATGLGGDQLLDMKRLISQFEKENPNIQVKIWPFPGGFEDVKTKLLVLQASGKGADVIHTTVDWTDVLIKSNMLLEVSDLFKSSKFDFSKYVKFSPTYLRKGKIWGGLESHAQVYPLFYNVGLINKAGLISPNDHYYQSKDWNWTTFMEMATKLTVDINGDGKPDQFGTMAPPWWESGWGPWILSNNAELFNEDNTKCTMDSPKAIQAIEFYADMVRKRVASPSFDGIEKGKIAMAIEGSWRMNHYNRALKFDWDVAHPPKGTVYRTWFNPGANGLVYKYTRHPKEAFKLVQFFLSEFAQMQYAKDKLIVPVMKKALDSDTYLSPPPKHMKVIGEMADYGVGRPVFDGWPECGAILDAAVSAAISGKKAPDIALRDAAAASNKILARIKR